MLLPLTQNSGVSTLASIAYVQGITQGRENIATIFPAVEAEAQPFPHVINSVPEKSPGPGAVIKYSGTQRL